jgi:hypothetical protein
MGWVCSSHGKKRNEYGGSGRKARRKETSRKTQTSERIILRLILE